MNPLKLFETYYTKHRTHNYAGTILSVRMKWREVQNDANNYSGS